MKKILYSAVWEGFLILIFFSGCASVDKPGLNMESIVAKLRFTEMAKAFDKEETVGVFIEAKERKHAEKAGNKIMASLKEAGIPAVLLDDENDPRLENTEILLHINVVKGKGPLPSEIDTLTGLMVSSAGGMVGSAVVMLGGTVLLLTQPQWLDKTIESYFTTIYDIKTEMKEYYFCIRPEEVANVVKRGKVVFKVKSNPMESVKDDDWQVRRMAIEALGSMKDSHSVKFLISALSDKSFVVRTEAARNLGELKDVNAVEPLLVTLKDDDWPAVRVEVARALGKIKDTRAVEPLITALKDDDWQVRRAAAEALCSMKDLQAVEPLIASLRDKDQEVRVEAARTLGKLKDVRAVEPLITALKDEHLNTTQDTIGLHRDAIKSKSMALSEITGKNFGYSYIAWQEWWEQNKDIFLNSR